MMSPLAKSLCSLVGIAAAGVPLYYFTAPPPPPASAPATPAAATAVRAAMVRVRTTEAPRELRILHEGAELCCVSAAAMAADGTWTGELLLPVAREWELEVEAEWDTPGSGARAVTLELSPPQLPTCRDTQWAAPGAHNLHEIFTFKW